MRRRPSAGTVISIIALVVALGGTGYAAITLPRNSVGSPQLKSGAVTGAKIKKSSVTSAKIAPNAVDGARIRNGSVTAADLAADVLAKVPSAQTADTATTAQTAAKTAGVSIIPLTRLTPTSGATLGAGRAAAPEVTLLTRGVISITAKCFRDAGSGQVGADVYAFSSAAGSIMSSTVDSLEGDGGGTAFLNPTTPDTSRQLESEVAIANNASFNPQGHDFAVIGADGTALRGQTYAAVKSGTLVTQGVYGAGDTCLVGGFALG